MTDNSHQTRPSCADGDRGDDLIQRQSRLYLDYNATTPIDPTVVGAIADSLRDDWGNASSSHGLGQTAKAAITTARQRVAAMIEANANEIIFMSGGTEANHTVLNIFSRSKGLGTGSPLPHVITSAIEHDSIRLPLERMAEKEALEVTFVPVNPRTAAVDVADIMAAIRPSTALVSIMLANNETGVLQPVREISEALRHYCQATGHVIHFHTDAAQAIGKIPVSVKDLGVDYLTVVGHKFYGPRIGALFVRSLGGRCNPAPYRPVFVGGGQERGYRAGTENTAMIVGLGKACQLVTDHLADYQRHMRLARDRLEQRLTERFGSLVTVNARSSDRLPNTSSVSFVGAPLRGRRVLDNCNQLIAGVGAACHSHEGNDCGSAVLRASGVSVENARNAIRLSVGRSTTPEDIDEAVDDLAQAIKKFGDSN